ncbi:MAG: hypothetical protein LC775_07860 [Acidobacteria bacterium]|nr:hypothetical protein [Acidobacteriota bacterium]
MYAPRRVGVEQMSLGDGQTPAWSSWPRWGRAGQGEGLLVLSSIRAALAQRLGRPVSASVVWRLWARTGATRPIESGQSICYYPGQFYLLLTLRPMGAALAKLAPQFTSFGWPVI